MERLASSLYSEDFWVKRNSRAIIPVSYFELSIVKSCYLQTLLILPL